MSKKTLRPAIAMIELIFALVIMGIVLMTAPMLVNTAAKSAYVSVQQENINEAASRLNMIMGYPWDEGNVENNTFNTILKTDSTVSDLDEENRTINITTVEGYRVGTPIESLRNFNVPGNPSGMPASALVVDGKDDIDDFAGTIGLELNGTGTGADYIEDNVAITTTIAYIEDDTNEVNYNHPSIRFDPDFDNPVTPGTRNIKSITATLTSVAGSPDELNKTIILRAFSCNIGGYELVEKDVN